MAPRGHGRRVAARPCNGRAARRPPLHEPGRLFCGKDHGEPVLVPPERFAPKQQGGGWGPFVEPFLRLNRGALDAIDVRSVLSSGLDGVALHLVPRGRAGAIPLRAANSGHVVGGFVVRPRFDWAGVGRVLTETGWHAGPEILGGPLVPGSGREVPPWVLAGPALVRLEALLRAMRPGYRFNEELLTRPRGRILWDRYAAMTLARGAWHRIPCRFPDLGLDPLLRRHVRWVLERLHGDLTRVGGQDPVARFLVALALRLLDEVGDAHSLMPRREDLQRHVGASRLGNEALRSGIEAMGWISEERGLGGGRELDGVAWALPLERLWESYVEGWVRRDVAARGGTVKVDRLRETTLPFHWSDRTHGSLEHLAPDFVVRRGQSVWIVDAKYKAHLAELDEHGWGRFSDDVRAAHRADVHQVLAYAALFDADDVTATLVYPLRHGTWQALDERQRACAVADLVHGGRRLRLELRGIPFGSGPHETVRDAPGS